MAFVPRPEGGWYAETWRAETKEGERASGTAIYYLLEPGKKSHWHRIDSAEIWHYYAGAPLKLSISKDGEQQNDVTLGPDIAAGAVLVRESGGFVSEIEGGKNFLSASSILAANPEVYDRAQQLVMG